MRMLIDAKLKSTGKKVQFSVMRLIDVKPLPEERWEVRYDAGDAGTETVTIDREAYENMGSL